MKVIILSASTGGGHMSAANAIKDYLISKNHTAEVIDTIEYIRKKTKKEFSLSTNLRNSSLSVKIFVTFPMLIGKKILIPDETIRQREAKTPI